MTIFLNSKRRTQGLTRVRAHPEVDTGHCPPCRGAGAQVTLRRARSRDPCSSPGVRLLLRAPDSRPPNHLLAFVSSSRRFPSTVVDNGLGDQLGWVRTRPSTYRQCGPTSHPSVPQGPFGKVRLMKGCEDSVTENR